MRAAFIRETATAIFTKRDTTFSGLEKPLAADAVRAATALADALGLAPESDMEDIVAIVKRIISIGEGRAVVGEAVMALLRDRGWLP